MTEKFSRGIDWRDKAEEIRLSGCICARDDEFCYCKLWKAFNEGFKAGQESKLSDDFIDMIRENERKETLEEVIELGNCLNWECLSKDRIEALKKKEVK